MTLRVAMADAAPFLPSEIFSRLREQQQHRITKTDELVLHCDEERTQGRNLKLAFERLQALVDEAAYEPKEYTSRLETPPPSRMRLHLTWLAAPLPSSSLHTLQSDRWPCPAAYPPKRKSWFSAGE